MRHTFFLTLAIVALQGMTFSGMQAAAEAAQARNTVESFDNYFRSVSFYDQDNGYIVKVHFPHHLLQEVERYGSRATFEYFLENNRLPAVDDGIAAQEEGFFLEDLRREDNQQEEPVTAFTSENPSLAEGIGEENAVAIDEYFQSEDIVVKGSDVGLFKKYAEKLIRLRSEDRIDKYVFIELRGGGDESPMMRYLVPRALVDSYLCNLIDVGEAYGEPRDTIYSAIAFIGGEALQGEQFRKDFKYFITLLSAYATYSFRTASSMTAAHNFLVRDLAQKITSSESRDEIIAALLRSASYVIRYNSHYVSHNDSFNRLQHVHFSHETVGLMEALYIATDLGKSTYIHYFDGIQEQQLREHLSRGVQQLFISVGEQPPRFPAQPRELRGNSFRAASKFVDFALRNYRPTPLGAQGANGEERSSASSQNQQNTPDTFHAEGALNPGYSFFGSNINRYQPPHEQQEQGDFMMLDDVAMVRISPRQFRRYYNNDFAALLADLPSLMTGLDLSGCSISEIPEGAFERFPHLHILNLSGCGIEKIHPNAFKIGRDVIDERTNINEHDCRLSEHSPLLMLDLSHNQLRTLHSDLFIWTSRLHYLDISNNPLEGLHPDFAYMPELRTLNMAFTHYETLRQHAFWNNQRLQVLDLSSHQEHQLSISLSQLENLTRLTMLFIRRSLLEGSDEDFERVGARLSRSRLALFVALRYDPQAERIARYLTDINLLNNRSEEDNAAQDMPVRSVSQPVPGVVIRLDKRVSPSTLSGMIKNGVRWMQNAGLISEELRSDIEDELGHHTELITNAAAIQRLLEVFGRTITNSVDNITSAAVYGSVISGKGVLERGANYFRSLVSKEYNDALDEQSRRASRYLSRAGQASVKTCERRKTVLTVTGDIASTALLVSGIGGLVKGGVAASGIPLLIAQKVLMPYLLGPIMKQFVSLVGDQLIGLFDVSEASQLLDIPDFQNIVLNTILGNNNVRGALPGRVVEALESLPHDVSTLDPGVVSQVRNTLESNNNLVSVVSGAHRDLVSNLYKSGNLITGGLTGLTLLPFLIEKGCDWIHGIPQIMERELAQSRTALQLLPLFALSLEAGTRVVAPLALMIDAFSDQVFLAQTGRVLARHEGWNPHAYDEEQPAVEEVNQVENEALNFFLNTRRIRPQFPLLHEMWNQLHPDTNENNGFHDTEHTVAAFVKWMDEESDSDVFDTLTSLLDHVPLEQYKVLFPFTLTSVEHGDEQAMQMNYQKVLSRCVQLFKYMREIGMYCITRSTIREPHALHREFSIPLLFFNEEALSTQTVQMKLGQALGEVITQLIAHLSLLTSSLRREVPIRGGISSFSVLKYLLIIPSVIRRGESIVQPIPPLTITPLTPQALRENHNAAAVPNEQAQEEERLAHIAQDAEMFKQRVGELINILQKMWEKLHTLMPELGTRRLLCEESLRRFIPKEYFPLDDEIERAHREREVEAGIERGPANAAGGGNVRA